jgi:hypothetical protein
LEAKKTGRVFAPVLTLLLIVGGGAAIYMSPQKQWAVSNLKEIKAVNGFKIYPVKSVEFHDSI